MQALPGIPFTYQHVNGIQHKGSSLPGNKLLSQLETCVKFDTLQSISEYPGSELTIANLQELAGLAFGNAKKGQKAFWEHELIWNSHSSKLNSSHPNDGSFSIGITVGE